MAREISDAVETGSSQDSATRQSGGTSPHLRGHGTAAGTRAIILTADDYAMTEGISRAIEQLAQASRLSATSAMVTMPGWPQDAKRIRALRDKVCVGLHLNFTLGLPATALPKLAPSGIFPSLRTLLLAAMTGRLDHDEIAREVRAQLDLFERHFGFAPDHVDGHQHVQVLPVIRRALFEACSERYRASPPLLRDPSARGGAKALIVSALSTGFATSARQRQLPVNDAFAGFSAFDVEASYNDELDTALAINGQRSIVMCHPGFPDATLAALDPVVRRRQQEYEALMSSSDLAQRIWHPARDGDGAVINWSIP